MFYPERDLQRMSEVMGFPGGTVVKNLPTNVGDARDVGSIPGWGRSPGVGNGNPLQHSCLGNPRLQSMWLWRVRHSWAHMHSEVVGVLVFTLLHRLHRPEIKERIATGLCKDFAGGWSFISFFFFKWTFVHHNSIIVTNQIGISQEPFLCSLIQNITLF